MFRKSESFPLFPKKLLDETRGMSNETFALYVKALCNLWIKSRLVATFKDTAESWSSLTGSNADLWSSETSTQIKAMFQPCTGCVGFLKKSEFNMLLKHQKNGVEPEPVIPTEAVAVPVLKAVTPTAPVIAAPEIVAPDPTIALRAFMPESQILRLKAVTKKLSPEYIASKIAMLSYAKPSNVAAYLYSALVYDFKLTPSQLASRNTVPPP